MKNWKNLNKILKDNTQTKNSNLNNVNKNFLFFE